MATPLKILFADDDLKYSLLLKRFLEKEAFLSGRAAGADQRAV